MSDIERGMLWFAVIGTIVAWWWLAAHSTPNPNGLPHGRSAP